MSSPVYSAAAGALTRTDGHAEEIPAKGQTYDAVHGAAHAEHGSTPESDVDGVAEGSTRVKSRTPYSNIIHLDIPTVTKAPGYKHLEAILAKLHHLAPRTPFALIEALDRKPALLEVINCFSELAESFAAFELPFVHYGHYQLSSNCPCGPTIVGAEGTTRHFRFWFGGPAEHLKLGHGMMNSAIKALVECGVFISGCNYDDGVRVDIRTLDAVALLRCAQTTPCITWQHAPRGVLRALTGDYEELTLPYVAAKKTPQYPGDFLREWLTTAAPGK